MSNNNTFIILFIFLALWINSEVKSHESWESEDSENTEALDNIMDDSNFNEEEMNANIDEYLNYCNANWTSTKLLDGAPPTPPINTIFSINHDIGTYIVHLSFSSSLTSQITQGIYNAAIVGATDIPVIGTVIGAIGSFFDSLFGGGGEEEINIEVNLTPFFQEFANYMDQYVAQTDYQNEITNIQGFYVTATSAINGIVGLTVSEQFNALQIANSSLAGALSIYKDNEDINKYAYYSFDYLYLNASIS